MPFKKAILLFSIFVICVNADLVAQLYGAATCPSLVNITCPAGSTWSNERNAVALILMPKQKADGTYDYEADGITIKYIAVGTGTLINNTCGYDIPYFLTAKHLTVGFKGNDYSKWKFVFGYWSNNCTPNVYPEAENLQKITGATLIASSTSTDFLLFKLITKPLNVFYAGWTTSSTPPTNAAILYHPNGDLMKITTSSSIVTSTSLAAHWDVKSMSSPTEGGASGGAVFDQNKHIIGQLHGGTGPCPYTIQAGRFDLSWNGEGSAQTRLKDWLDPYGLSAGGGVITVNGVSSVNLITDPQFKTKTISGPSSIDYTIAQNYNYTIPGISSTLSVAWQSSDPTVLSVSGTNLNAVATIKKNFFGVVNITATINTGCGLYTLSAFPVTVSGFAPVCGSIVYKSGIGMQMSVSMPDATQYRWREGSINATPIAGATYSNYTYPYGTLCPNNGDGTYFNGTVVFYAEAYRPAKGWSLPCQISYNFNCSTQTMSTLRCTAIDPSLAKPTRSITAVNNATARATVLKLFPTPADNKINIQFEIGSKSPVVLQLLNAFGAVLINKNIVTGAKTATLDVSAIPGGFYFLNVLKDDKHSAYKIMIRH